MTPTTVSHSLPLPSHAPSPHPPSPNPSAQIAPHVQDQAPDQAPDQALGAEQPALIASLPGQLASVLFAAVVIWLLWRGWQIRDQYYLTAESGIGYWLGIIGGSLMLALLLYPARKHVRWMRTWGPIRHWFRIHMMFGVLGPTLILFHSNFSLGSTNSRVALFCMLLVAGSGLIGRYLYSRIHFGLYGKRASLVELTDLVRQNRQQLHWVKALSPAFLQRLEQLEQRILAASSSQPVVGQTSLTAAPVASSLTPLQWLALRWFNWQEYRQLKRLLMQSLNAASATRQQQHDARQFLRSHQAATARVLELRFYERLFSLWHVVHLPFFLMLVVAGVVHVIAVHLY